MTEEKPTASAEREPFVYKRKTDAELETLAWDVVGGKVFGSWSRTDALDMCFLPITLSTADQIKELMDAGIAHAYEYLDKAGPRAINGMPTFFSCQLIDVEDTKRLKERVDAIVALKKSREAAAS